MLLSHADHVTYEFLVYNGEFSAQVLNEEYTEDILFGENERPMPISGDVIASYKRLYWSVDEEPTENNISALLLIEYSEMNVHTVAELLGIDPEFPNESLPVSGDDITFLKSNGVI